MIRAADPQTRPQVLEILDSAQSLGLKVLRMWAFDEGPMQYNTLQRYPGQPPSIPHREATDVCAPIVVSDVQPTKACSGSRVSCQRTGRTSISHA